jgi:hypothetical protein
MVLEIPVVRQAYDQVLTHEVRQAVRKLRALPLTRLDDRRSGCGRTLREMAEGFVTRLRRIDAIAFGHASGHVPAGPRPLGVILVDLETSFLGAHTSLAAMTPAQWGELVQAPRALSGWSQARRGELLWLALRELIRHGRHFSLHVRAECLGLPAGDDDLQGRPSEFEPMEPVGAGA